MKFPVQLVFPVGDGFLMVMRKVDDTPRKVAKTINAFSQDELDRLTSMGWKVKE